MRTIKLTLLILGMLCFPGVAHAAIGTVRVVNGSDVPLRVTCDTVQAKLLEPDDSVDISISVGTRAKTVKLLVYQIKSSGKAELKASASISVQAGVTSLAMITATPKPNGDLIFTVTVTSPIATTAPTDLSID
jgi:hypothetical protein